MKDKHHEKMTKIIYEEGGNEEVSMPFDKSNMLLFISLIFMVSENYWNLIKNIIKI